MAGKNMRGQNYCKGVLGEKAAEELLEKSGLCILERRYRSGDGEVDLICEEGNILVFVEVKLRSKGQPGEGILAVTPSKQRRIGHAAMGYLMEKQLFDRPLRFDIVEITAGGALHIPNAFVPADWSL